MNKIICVALCLLCLILSQCKTAKVKPVSPAAAKEAPASTAPASSAAAPAPDDMLAADISKGKTVYESKCYSCHDLPRPADFGASEWQDIMVKMSRKAHLTADETNQVVKYVCAYARK